MSESFFVNCEELCTREQLFLHVDERGWDREERKAKEMGADVSPGRLEAQASRLPWDDTEHVWAAYGGSAWSGPGPGQPWPPAGPHAPAVGGHVSEDSEQELASVAWLEGGGDDDVAALGLLRAQEDAAGVDVDGAGGPVLQAVHTVLAVLLHLPGGGSTGSQRAPLSSHPASLISAPLDDQNRQIYSQK